MVDEPNEDKVWARPRRRWFRGLMADCIHASLFLVAHKNDVSRFIFDRRPHHFEERWLDCTLLPRGSQCTCVIFHGGEVVRASWGGPYPTFSPAASRRQPHPAQSLRAGIRRRWLGTLWWSGRHLIIACCQEAPCDKTWPRRFAHCHSTKGLPCGQVYPCRPGDIGVSRYVLC